MKKSTAVKLARGRFDTFCDQFQKEIPQDIMRFMCECFQDLDNAWVEYLKEQRKAAFDQGVAWEQHESHDRAHGKYKDEPSKG